tara:strand:- start:59 stop:247 length:189 start_codon:yes stop_codon:yes gene_type:complete
MERLLIVKLLMTVETLMTVALTLAVSVLRVLLRTAQATVTAALSHGSVMDLKTVKIRHTVAT